MTPLPSSLVLDSTVLIAAVLGRTGAVIERVQYVAALVTTDRMIEESRRKIEFGLKAPDLVPLVDLMVEALAIVSVAELESFLPNAETVLRDAVPSRNGSVRDAHVLALAWCTGADVWTSDRDFAGTGVASWSTLNLVRALSEINR
jgi:predicted nucleic acid-binding protein